MVDKRFFGCAGNWRQCGETITVRQVVSLCAEFVDGKKENYSYPNIYTLDDGNTMQK